MKRTVFASLWALALGVVLVAGCGVQAPAPAESGKVQALTDETFDAAVAQGVVLVDFWAPWCGPCRIQGPLVDQTAGLLGDTAKVAKLNVDVGQKTAQKFGIQSIPTLIVFKDGKPAKQFVGVTQPDTLAAAVKAALGGSN